MWTPASAGVTKLCYICHSREACPRRKRGAGIQACRGVLHTPWARAACPYSITSSENTTENVTRLFNELPFAGMTVSKYVIPAKAGIHENTDFEAQSNIVKVMSIEHPQTSPSAY